jgi:hypothetical protein
MIIDLLLSALFGLGLHQAKRVTSQMPNGWENIADHSVGGVGLLLAWPYWYKRLAPVHDGFIRGWLSLAMALLSIGAGVVAGWVLDGERDK